MKVALVSEHASPLAAVGGVDSGGQNVHVGEVALALGRLGAQVTVYTRRDNVDTPDRVSMAPSVVVEHLSAGPPSTVPKDELWQYMPEFKESCTPAGSPTDPTWFTHTSGCPVTPPSDQPSYCGYQRFTHITPSVR